MRRFWKIVGMVTLVAIIGVAGTSSVAAQQPSGEWQALAAGESQWYSFEYAGDGSRIEVWLDAEPDESVAFSIWTGEQVELWAAGEEIAPVGRGTANAYEPGDLFWAGAFGIRGEYYIVVENASSGDASFQLDVTD